MLKSIRYTIFFIIFFYSWASFAVTEITFWHSMAGPLGNKLNDIINQFNISHPQYHIVSIYKGDYNQTLTATVAAFRAQQQPDIVQIFEVGTATMLNPQGIIVPVYQLFHDAHLSFASNDILPPIRFYYSDRNMNLLAMPFNSSSPVLFYNQNAFKKAGISIQHPPKTWPQVFNDAQKLLKAGYRCGFTTTWPSWTQLENFSAWHNLPFATEQNGFNNNNAQLVFNNMDVIKHINTLAEWQKNNVFQYGGRGDRAFSLFTSQRCAMLIDSSGSVPDLETFSKFHVGISSLPYWPNIKDAPQNTSIGGAALWALTGHSKIEYRGIAEFFTFLAQPKIVAEWQQASGYLPITYSGYQYSIQSGFYKLHPGAEIAVKELIHKPITSNSTGIRLGNYMKIRENNEQILESIWSGQQNTSIGLNDAVKDGNILLKEFARNTNIH